jgi:hypothetical protein
VPGSIFFIVATLWKHRGTQDRRKKKSPQISQISQIFSIHNSKFIIHNFLKMFLFFILPLTLWAYLPLRASCDPALNWGDPDTSGKFFDHILAKHYHAYFVNSPKILLQNLKIHIPFFSKQFPLYILWLSVIGLFLLARKRKVFLFFLLIIGVNTIHSIRFTMPNLYEMYYIPSFILISILIGLGLAGLSRLIRKPILLLIFMILPIFLINRNHYLNDKSSYYLAYDVGKNILMTVDYNPIIFEGSDITGFPLFYLTMVLGMRSDLIHVPLPFLGHPWYPPLLQKLYPKEFSFYLSKQTHALTLNDYIHSFILHNISVHSIYIDSPEYVSSWTLIPAGLLFKVCSSNEEMQDISYCIRVPDGYKDKNAQIVLGNYATAYTFLGKQKEAKAIQKILGK